MLGSSQWNLPCAITQVWWTHTSFMYKFTQIRSSPGKQRQNLVGASFSNMSLQASTNGPKISTGRGEEYSTFWTRWYMRLTPSVQGINQSNLFQRHNRRETLLLILTVVSVLCESFSFFQEKSSYIKHIFMPEICLTNHHVRLIGTFKVAVSI